MNTDNIQIKTDAAGKFRSAAQKFFLSVLSLGFAFPISLDAVSSKVKEELDDLLERWVSGGETVESMTLVQEAIHKVIEMAANNEKSKTVELNLINVNGFEALINGYFRMKSAEKLVARGFIITLESQIDLLMSDTVRAIYAMRPDIMDFHSREVKLGEVIAAGSLENYQSQIVEQEIDALSRKGHAAQVEWIEKRLKVQLTPKIPTWKAFLEIAERRNLYTHTDGRISQQYLDAAKKYGFEVSEDFKIGKEIEFTREYFDNALNVTIEHGMNVLFCCWSIVEKNKEDKIVKLAEELSNQINLLSFHGYGKLSSRVLNNVCKQRDFGGEAKKIIESARFWLNKYCEIAEPMKTASSSFREESSD